ncbi:tape measure protein [Bergeyella porcorum]|uniref:tape measure protein n=1 Tax=Bergeyella porcorum TaxID=1735111 RepID=UPI0035E7F6D8
MSALNFEALLTKDDFDRGIKSIKDSIREAAGIAKKETAEMDSAFKKLGIGISGYLSASALQGFAMQLINVRGEFQKTEIAFSTMLKSKEKAKVLMGEMVDLAAKTPFGLQEVTEGAKRLLAFQIPAEQVTETLRRMGDIAAGLGVPMGQLIHVYGQVKAQGKLMTNDLYQFMNAGIPILAELGKVMGKKEAEIKKMVEEGKIGFAEVQQVIQNMTNEGGIFFNLMEAQSSSLPGKVANLKDAFEQMLNKIGESNEGLLAEGIEGLTYLVENYEDVIRVLSIVVATYGTYRAALIATSALQKIQVWAEGTQAALKFAQGISGMTKAQLLFNAAANANPYILAASALAAVVGAIVYLKTATEDAKTVTEQMTEAINAATASASEESNQLNKLYNAATDETKSRKERIEAVNTLQRTYPSYFSNMSTEIIMAGKAKNAYYDLRDAIVASARAKAIQSELEKREGDRLKRDAELQGKMDVVLKRYKANNYKDQEGSLGTGTGATYKITAEQRKKRDQELYYDLVKQKQANQKADLEADKFYLDQKEELDRKAEKLNKDRELNAQSSTPPTPPNDKGNNKNKNTKGNQRELAEVYSKDSIADLEERISLWNNALKRASKGEDGKLIVKERAKDKYGDEKETGNVVSGEYALEQLRILEEKKRALEKELETKTFQEKINEAERHWNNYYKMAEYYGKESANAQYSELFKGSQSYLDFLEKEAEALANKPGILSDEDKENLIFLQDKIQNLSGAKTPLENWKSELADSLRGVTLLSEQIDIIDNKVAEIYAKEGKSSNFLQFNKEAEAQKTQIENQISDMYHSVLENQKSFNKKSEALENERQMMLKKAKNKEERELIDKEYSSRATDLFFNEMQKSEEWAKMFEDMNYVASEKLEEFKQILKKKLEEAKSIEEKMKIGEFIKRIDITLQSRNINPFKSFVDAFKEYKEKVKEAKEAQEKLNDVIKQFGANSEQAKNAQKTLGIAMNGVSESKIKMAESLANGAGKALSYIGDAKSIVSDIQGAFDDLGLSLDNGFGDILDKAQGALDGMQQQMDGLMSIAEGIITKNPVKVVAGAVKAIGGLIKTVSALFNNDRKKERNIKNWALALDKVKEKYRELEHQMKRTLGENEYKEQANIIANLRQQQKYLQNMAREEASKKKADKGKIEEWKNQMKEIDRSIDDIFNDIKTKLVGTDAKSLADEIGDALVDAFTRGEDAAEAYEKKMNDVMRNVVKNALKQKLLQEPMQAIIDDMIVKMGFGGAGDENVRRQIEEVEGKIKQMNDKIKNGNIFDKIYTGLSKIGLQNKLEELKKQYEESKKLNLQGTFDGLTDEERAEIKQKGVDAMERYTKALEEYELLFGASADNADSLKGAIKGMSEETAGVLAGQFNAIRINAADALRIWKEFQNKNFGLDIARDSLMALVNIERHTSNLEAIKKDISELNAKVKGDGGIRAGGF